MIAERARITAIVGSRMTLEPVTSGCSSCGAVKSCGTAKLSNMLPSGQRKLSMALVPGRRVGDEIELALPESALLAAAGVAYLPPLLGLVLGVVVGGSGAGGPIGAGLGLVLGLAASRFLSNALTGRFEPVPVGQAAPIHIIPIHKE